MFVCLSVCLPFFESADARDLGLMTLFYRKRVSKWDESFLLEAIHRLIYRAWSCCQACNKSRSPLALCFPVPMLPCPSPTRKWVVGMALSNQTFNNSWRSRCWSSWSTWPCSIVHFVHFIFDVLILSSRYILAVTKTLSLIRRSTEWSAGTE